jgi:hypothetical protein
MSSKRLLPLAACSWLLASCGGHSAPISETLEVVEVTTGWYDAGIQNGLNKLVPSIGLRLRNAASSPVRNVQLSAVFQRIDDEDPWGDSFLWIIRGEDLEPGATTDVLNLRLGIGYTSSDPRAMMLDHSQFKDCRVRVFAKHGPARPVLIGEWDIERTMLTR